MLGLAASAAPAIPDLDAAVGEVLDRRLLAASDRPIAVALSGGGDSLALTLTVAAWAARAGRPLLVLTVDHRLRTESPAWTAACGETAARLGATFRPLIWDAEKPSSGVPAAARAARHRLLADAARAVGARVILLGHTADDVHEARRMRAAGSTTPEPREWSPSPVWPQGRGLFLLRPLLGLGRADIRAWLERRGEAWIEDPANEDLRFARARARRTAVEGTPPIEIADAAPLARLVRPTPDGGFVVSRAALHAADPAAARRLIAAVCLCAAGTDRPPTRDRARRLTDQLVAGSPVIATLAGARIEADNAVVRILREAGEAARGGLSPLRLATGETAVWDGRFEIAADRPLEVRRLAGFARRLPKGQQAALGAVAPAARRGLPVIVEPDGSVVCPLLGEAAGVRIEPLAHARLLAACGAIAQESG